MSAPAGWYPDPEMVDTQRYWDGVEWTEHRAPTHTLAVTTPAGPHAPAAAAPPVSVPPAPGSPVAFAPGTGDVTAYAWSVALLPLIATGVAYFLPEIFVSTLVVTLVFGVPTLVLALLDVSGLKGRGVDTSGMVAWAVLIVPAYLIMRTRRVKSTPGIPLAWFGGVLAWTILAFVGPGPYNFNSEDLNADIADQLSSQIDTDVTVDCPEATNVVEGDYIECDITAKDGSSGTVRVTFDNGGGYTWQVTDID